MLLAMTTSRRTQMTGANRSVDVRFQVEHGPTAVRAGDAVGAGELARRLPRQPPIEVQVGRETLRGEPDAIRQLIAVCCSLSERVDRLEAALAAHATARDDKMR